MDPDSQQPTGETANVAALPTRAPAEEERLAAHCAAVAREMLGDFSPALLLLPGTERRRVRTLLAWAASLLADAMRTDPVEERVGLIDSWEADLTRALGGDAEAPPLCVRMARESARRRWPAGALEELIACARRRARCARPADAAAAEQEAQGLARAVGGALLEGRLNAEVCGFAGALVRLRAMQDLGGALARGRCPLPMDEVEAADGSGAPGELEDAVRRECARLRPWLLRAPRGLVELPAPYRRAGVFALLAALRLVSEIEEAGRRLAQAAPRLSTATRLTLLARARWSRLGHE